ncbi:MAG: LrgB family protein, partial [Anaerovorax sp.]
MMHDFFINNPLSGMTLTLGCFWLAHYLYTKTGWSIMQPVLVSGALIILVLLTMGVSYDEYYAQNGILNFMLPLTAVVLAVPLYRNIATLKTHAIPIAVGVVSGTLATMGSLVLMGKLMGTDIKMILTMLPKNATNPIAIEVSKIIGGVPELTVALVVVTGLVGTVFGPEIMNFMRIKNKVARGIAIGSMTHAVGTARAFKESEIEGSMSS